MENQDHVSLRQKSAYAVGMFVNNLQAAALPALLVILNLGLGMNPKWVGWIGFVPRLFDAASDPILGHISDHTRSRWGRRRPYIFAGAILSGVAFAAIWQLPAGQSPSVTFWFFLVMISSYFVIYTLFSTPLIALGFEMTSDFHERTRLQAFANMAGLLPWLLVSPWCYKIMTTDVWFEDKVEGARYLGLFIGLAMCLLGVIPAIFCREKPALCAAADTSAPPNSEMPSISSNVANFFSGVANALSCPPFLKICVATFLVFNGYQFAAFFSIYVIQYYVFAGNEDLAGELFGWFQTFTTACTLAVIPLATWLSTKIGKRRTFFVTISVSLIGYTLKWVGYDPAHPWLLLVAGPFVAFGIGSLFTLMSSMVADVCDYDELENGERREGLFGAIYWWMVKLGMAVAGLLAGYALAYSNFDVGLQGPQSEQTLLLLRVFDVLIPLVTSALAIAVMATYPISETRAREIRTELEARRPTSSP